MDIRYVVYRKTANLFLRTVKGIDWVKDVNAASQYKKLKTAKAEVKARNYLYDDMVVCTYDGENVTREGEEKPMNNMVENANTTEAATSESAVTVFSIEEANQKVVGIREHLTALSEIFKDGNDFNGILTACKEEEKKCDQETQDILHKIELSEINNIFTGYKYLIMLQEVRRRRRIAKDNRVLLDKLAQDGVVKVTKDIISCNQNMEHRGYNPRVLKELFEEE